MDGIVSAWCQDAGGLLHDLQLVLVCLHGQHCLADYDVGGIIRQPSLGGTSVDDLHVGR